MTYRKEGGWQPVQEAVVTGTAGRRQSPLAMMKIAGVGEEVRQQLLTAVSRRGHAGMEADRRISWLSRSRGG